MQQASTDILEEIGQTDPMLHALKDHVHFALQPIVDMRTGAAFGFEALLRGHDAAGFSQIGDVFDSAWDRGILHQVDMMLREIAIRQFAGTEACSDARLFYNLDGRIFESKDYHPHRTGTLLNQFQIRPEQLVLELSEQYDNASAMYVTDTLGMCRQHDYKLAIDDYGQGFSEMKMLYEHQPDFVKIDRFFIHDLDTNPKKRLFVSAIVNLAHVLGTVVIAEGVETEPEFLACKEIGCDLVQGYYVAPPSRSPGDPKPVYEIVPETNKRDQQQADTDAFLIRTFLNKVDSLRVTDDHDQIFDLLRRNRQQKVFPALDSLRRPLGVILESDLRDFIYLQQGRELLPGGRADQRIQEIVSYCPSADISTSVEHILEMYSIETECCGVLITEGSEYIGFLAPDTLLRLVNEKNLTRIRERSPLTGLPGRNATISHVSGLLADRTKTIALTQFDFDNLRAFNDRYGYREGDRAITVFADLLADVAALDHTFIGHLGGGCFLAVFENRTVEEAEGLCDLLTDKFAEKVANLGLDTAIEASVANDPDGQVPTGSASPLSCSTAVLDIPVASTDRALSSVMLRLDRLKHASKCAHDGRALGSTGPTDATPWQPSATLQAEVEIPDPIALGVVLPTLAHLNE